MVIGLRLSLLTAACVFFGSSTLARAESAVVLPHAGDTRLEAARTASHRAVVDTLREQSFAVRILTTKPARSPGEIQNNCTQIICAPAMLTATATDLAVGIAVWDGEDGPQVNITLVDALGRKYPGYAIILADDAATAARAAFLEARSLQLLGPGPWIHVRGAPAGAEVIIDAKHVGVLPYRGAISPGDHNLEVRAQGFSAKQLPIVVSLEPTTTALVELELARAAGAPAPLATPAAEPTPSDDYVSEDPARLPEDKASPWNFVLGGVLAAGGVALATIEPLPAAINDGECQNDSCSKLYDFGGTSLLKIGIGAVLLAGGVTVMIWQPIRVEAQLDPHHATLTTTLAF